MKVGLAKGEDLCISVSPPMRRLFTPHSFLLLCAIAAGTGRVCAQSGPAPVLSQSLPAQTLTVSGPATTVNLAQFFSNPAVPGTAVRISVILGDQGTGNIDVALTDQQTPLTVANFLAYINTGSYSANVIHRSMPGFVIQGGGYWVPGHDQLQPVGTMPPVLNEPGISNVRGTIAMAKQATSSNSATSQWFINLADNSANLDSQNGGFTVFGNVIGNTMTVADAIGAVPTYDASGPQFLNDPDFTNLPLTEPHLDTNYFIQTSIAVIPGMTFTASAANGPLVAVTVSGKSLVLTPARTSGSTTVTVTASALDGGQLTASFGVTVAPAPATVTLAGLAATFSGAALPVTVATNPAGLEVAVTYSGSATVPTNAGTYAVLAVVTDPNHTGSTSGTLVIAPAPATVDLANLTQAFTNAPCPATVTTSPAGLGLTVLYNGSATAPTGVGTYTVAATVSNPNYTGSASGTLSITPDFASYLMLHFTAQQLGNPAVTGPAANPAGDGMPNLLKYALGLDPTMEDAAAGTPVVSTTGGMLTLTYVCPPGITDVTYVVEVSGDLETWSSGAGATAVVSTTLLDAQHEQVVVRDLTPVSGQGRRFIRLRVTE